MASIRRFHGVTAAFRGRGGDEVVALRDPDPRISGRLDVRLRVVGR